MLNTTIYRNESKVVAVTKEIERTISPDKVTEMYDAVREEVEKNVVQVIRIEDNIMKGVVVEFFDDFRNHEKKARARFTLNGEEFMEEMILARDQLFTKSDAYMFLMTSYTQAITKYLGKHLVAVVLQSGK